MKTLLPSDLLYLPIGTKFKVMGVTKNEITYMKLIEKRKDTVVCKILYYPDNEATFIIYRESTLAEGVTWVLQYHYDLGMVSISTLCN
jgi:hypothetical protein